MIRIVAGFAGAFAVECGLLILKASTIPVYMLLAGVCGAGAVLLFVLYLCLRRSFLAPGKKVRSR